MNTLSRYYQPLLSLMLVAVAGCANWPPANQFSQTKPAVHGTDTRPTAVAKPQVLAKSYLDGYVEVRGQSPAGAYDSYTRSGMPASGGPASGRTVPVAAQTQNGSTFAPPPLNGSRGNASTGISNGATSGTRGNTTGGGYVTPPDAVFNGPQASWPTETPSDIINEPSAFNTLPFNVNAQESRTGRFIFGMGINSDAGLTGQVVVDERNFDIGNIPTSFTDFMNGGFKGAGQGFRIEAIPGDQLQRYLVSFTEPYLGSTPFSLNVSGFYYDRVYQDWIETRLGGRVSLGYRITHELSLSFGMRMENVQVRDPRFVGVADLDAVIGKSDLYSGQLTLTHDTRDIPFAPTEGHLIEMNFEQVFGTFDYPRAEAEYRKYHLVHERVDGSGRHTFSYSLRAGFSGSQTPIFENFFAGGFTTIRGFDFRGASPTQQGIVVGGEFRMLGSLEYMFPLTADDAIRGVVFVDYGTVEEKISIEAEDFRVAPGIGLRIAIPALGPAPLALDFAFPVAREGTDDLRNFSFFFGFSRL